MVAQPSLVPLRLHEMMTRFHKLVRSACDSYRPELHYMRGPGPKWRAKHADHKSTAA